MEGIKEPPEVEVKREREEEELAISRIFAWLLLRIRLLSLGPTRDWIPNLLIERERKRERERERTNRKTFPAFFPLSQEISLVLSLAHFPCIRVLKLWSAAVNAGK